MITSILKIYSDNIRVVFFNEELIHKKKFKDSDFQTIKEGATEVSKVYEVIRGNALGISHI